jgi:cyclophilin family peptidyl-prolyl cis-trans isomerase
MWSKTLNFLTRSLFGCAFFLALSFFSLAQAQFTPAPTPPKTWAVIYTSKGVIVAELFARRAPRTVANFVGLATGSKPWKDIKTGQMQTNKPFYDGIIFHRVIPKFMIQTGCPLGQGTGDAGYKFEDEFHPELKHDKPGILSMANGGPNTNGSQFFITHRPTPWLDGQEMKTCANFDRPVRCMQDMHCVILGQRYGKFTNKGPATCSKVSKRGHSVFGQVVYGQDVVIAIGDVPRGKNDKPLEPVVIKTIAIKQAADWDKSWLEGASPSPAAAEEAAKRAAQEAAKAKQAAEAAARRAAEEAAKRALEADAARRAAEEALKAKQAAQKDEAAKKQEAERALKRSEAQRLAKEQIKKLAAPASRPASAPKTP